MTNQNTPKFLTIDQASAYLKISSKTLRRWEDKGVITPLRTAGGHRRYTLEQIKEFRVKSNRKKIISAMIAEYIDSPVKYTPEPVAPKLPGKIVKPVLTQSTDTSGLYQTANLKHVFVNMAKPHKFLAMFSVLALVIITATTFGYKIVLKSDLKIGQLDSNNPIYNKQNNFQEMKKLLVEDANNKAAGVLAATSFSNVKFSVNVESTFRQDSAFLQNVNIDQNAAIGGSVDIAGNLAVNGGNVTTTNQEINLFNENALSINLGSQADLISLGSTT